MGGNPAPALTDPPRATKGVRLYTMLVAKDTYGVRWKGRDAERGLEYFCPGCDEVVTLKKGSRVIHHFAHKPGADCDFATGETVRHMVMKQVVADNLAAHAEIEVPVLGRRRADVLVDVDGQRVVVECQHSALSEEEVEQREFDYNLVGPLVWVLDSSLFFKHYRPRAGFEKSQGRVTAIVKTLVRRDQPILFLYEDDLFECLLKTYDDYVVDEWGARTVTRYITQMVDRIYPPWTLSRLDDGSFGFRQLAPYERVLADAKRQLF